MIEFEEGLNIIVTKFVTPLIVLFLLFLDFICAQEMIESGEFRKIPEWADAYS
jgi:hypothetical protein